MSSPAELACVYAALILTDDDVAVTGEKIKAILKTANVDVEPYWPELFAKALNGVNIKDLITNIASSVGSTPAVGTVATAPAEAAVADAPATKDTETESEESDSDLGVAMLY